MSDIKVSIDAGKIQENSKWFLMLGIALIIFGFIGVSASFLATKLFVTVLGILLMLSGIAQISHVAVSPRWQAGILKLFLGLIYVGAGISFIKNPTVAAALFTLIIAYFLIGSGILKVLISINHRYSKEWTLGLFSGILSAILGVMLLTNWPISGIWFIGFVISLEMIFTGWTYVAFATGAKNLDPNGSIDINIHEK
jgi:uncharacterized membrane protein HdeD (DUF308 family)